LNVINSFGQKITLQKNLRALHRVNVASVTNAEYFTCT